MKRRIPIAALLAIVFSCFIFYVALFGLYPRYFDISWDEEVRLNDGSMIVVHVKDTYERRGSQLSRYADAVRRRTQIAFDAGPGLGHITFSTRLGIRLLDRIERNWYVVLFGQGPFGNFPDETPVQWGLDFSKSEERLAKLRDGRFIPISWDEAPANAITAPNFLLSSISIESFVEQYTNTRLTLDDKAKLKLAHPPGPTAELIARPIRFDKTKGELR
jgi:hypothetical protein